MGQHQRLPQVARALPGPARPGGRHAHLRAVRVQQMQMLVYMYIPRSIHTGALMDQ